MTKVLFCICALASVFAHAGLSVERPVDIDLGRQLFLDDVLFEKNTMTRAWHKPVDDPRNPVMKPETPLI